MASRLPIQAFAVEDDQVQLTWSWLPAPDLSVEVGAACVRLPSSPPAVLHRKGRRPRQLGAGPIGPGAVTVAGLDPATTYDITATGPSLPRTHVGRLRTLARPAGAATARFATVNDMHLGERAFGGLHTIIEPTPLPSGTLPYPERAARAAITEAAAWGAQRLVVKGDLTRDSEPVEFREVGRMLAAAPMPTDVILGNHDVRHRVDGPQILASCGVEPILEARAVDLPGLRLVLGHTPVPSERRGRLGRREEQRIVTLAGEVAPGPVVVALHHAPQPRPVATFYPPGLYRTETLRFVRALREANPSALILAGHTHRNRISIVEGVAVIEVGSTKDHPGVWAGYAVHEGGIRQVVRRIADPAVLAWTEPSGQALYGGWGRWAPGRLEDRCWTRDW